MTVVSDLTPFRIPDAAALERASFSSPWSENALREELNSPYANYFCVTSDGRLAGYGGFLSLSGEGEITRIAVFPEFRRKGFAAMLMHRIMSRAAELNIGTMFLEVRESNAPAISLYRKFGFEQVGLRPDYYSLPKEAAVLMSADISKYTLLQKDKV
ncbi:MAG: ribosomal protein S18-alanine N-acetyltransferase [Clostridiales bacterium]|nr:ribosomal protein S18-alanine N-acetyltransferase [Clostridiales bacterium]